MAVKTLEEFLPVTSIPSSGNVPAGTIIAWASNSATIPVGYLLCNGAAVSRTTYSALFTAIGTIYGVGDGSTTFNLPDGRKRFLRGFLSGTTEAIGTPQESQNLEHNHSYVTGSGTTEVDVIYRGGTSVSPGTGVVQNSGGTEARPSNYAIQWLIKYGGG